VQHDSRGNVDSSYFFCLLLLLLTFGGGCWLLQQLYSCDLETFGLEGTNSSFFLADCLMAVECSAGKDRAEKKRIYQMKPATQKWLSLLSLAAPSYKQTLFTRAPEFMSA
jgi:hypothetical protein